MLNLNFHFALAVKKTTHRFGELPYFLCIDFRYYGQPHKTISPNLDHDKFIPNSDLNLHLTTNLNQDLRNVVLPYYISPLESIVNCKKCSSLTATMSHTGLSRRSELWHSSPQGTFITFLQILTLWLVRCQCNGAYLCVCNLWVCEQIRL